MQQLHPLYLSLCEYQVSSLCVYYQVGLVCSLSLFLFKIFRCYWLRKLMMMMIHDQESRIMNHDSTRCEAWRSTWIMKLSNKAMILCVSIYQSSTLSQAKARCVELQKHWCDAWIHLRYEMPILLARLYHFDYGSWSSKQCNSNIY